MTLLLPVAHTRGIRSDLGHRISVRDDCDCYFASCNNRLNRAAHLALKIIIINATNIYVYYNTKLLTFNNFVEVCFPACAFFIIGFDRFWHFLDKGNDLESMNDRYIKEKNPRRKT